MNLSFKNLIITGLLLLLHLTSGAADTLKIHVVYRHRLDSTGHSTGRIAVNQKLYTPEKELFREISFDEITGQMTGYVFYFYHDGRLFTQEYYNQSDSLLYILKHEYDPSGNEIRLTRLQMGNKGLSEAEKTVRNYTGNHGVALEKHYYGKKPGSETTYLYSGTGSLIEENSKFKPAAGSSYLKLTRFYTYSPENKLTTVTVSGIEANGNPFRYREEYRYDSNGRIAAIETSGTGAGAFAGRKVYLYLSDGSISVCEEYNAAGKLVRLLEYDYKMHYMERGTQVSRYEDF